MRFSNAEPVCGRYNWSDTSPSLAVVDAIAVVEDVEPTDLHQTLGTTLYDQLDPEALDSLVTSASHVTISFTIGEYRIRIDGDELAISFE